MIEFHQGHYNLIAKQFRNQFKYIISFHDTQSPHDISIRATHWLCVLRFTERFSIEDPSFNPRDFLEKCDILGRHNAVGLWDIKDTILGSERFMT